MKVKKKMVWPTYNQHMTVAIWLDYCHIELDLQCFITK